MLARICLFVFGLLMLLISPIVAQTTYSWNGTSGSFSDASRWSPTGGPPGSADNAHFTSGSAFTVSGNGGPFQMIVDATDATFTGALSPAGSSTNSALIVGSVSSGHATFSGSGASLTAGAPVAVGPFGISSLTFSGGATGSSLALTGNSGAALLGLNSTGNGTLTITGTGSMYTSTGSFDLGGAGRGTVDVEDNAHLDTNGILSFGDAGLNIAVLANSHGTLNISGDATVHNELQTNLGLGGIGIINISSGMFTTTAGGTTNPALSIGRFSTAQGDLNVSGTGLVTTEGEIIVGGDGIGRMTVTDEGQVQSNVTVGQPALVGFGASSTGTATIDGIDADWKITDALVVGQQGFGTVNLNNGGTLFVEDTVTGGAPYLFIGEEDGASGRIKVQDEFSLLDASFIPVTLGVDENSNGSLEISDQGQAFLQRTIVGRAGYGEVYVETNSVLTTGTLIVGEKMVGEDSDGGGLVSVYEDSSLEVLGQLIVADEGIGEVYIEDSSLEVLEFIVIGDKAGSEGTLSVSEFSGTPTTVGGLLTSLTVGNLGGGSLDITGAMASMTVNGPTNVAVGTGSTGDVSVGTGATFTTSGTLTVGDQGDATFSVSNGQSGTMFIAKTGGNSSAQFGFGTWTINNSGPDNGSLFVGGSDTAVGGTGQLAVSNGTLNVNNRVKIYSGSLAELNTGGIVDAAAVEVDGRLLGTGAVNAATIDVSGAIEPKRGGNPTGRLSFTGDLTFQPGSLFQVEITGTTPQTEFDVIDITGNVMLDGLLSVFVLPGFTLSPGLSFEIINLSGTQTGMFAGLVDGALVNTFGGVDLFIDYDGGDGNDVVLFTNGIAASADFDMDGDVDGADFLKWQRGGTSPPLDPAALALWQAQYGSSLPLAETATGVPEPNCYILVALGLFAATFTRYSPAKARIDTDIHAI